MAGSDSATFYYKDTASGTPAITAADTGYTSDTQVETVNPGAIDHYAVSNVNSQIAGTDFTVNIQAQDAYDNNLTGSEVIAISSGKPDAGAEPTSVTTTNGEAAVSNMILTMAQTGQTIIFTGATSGKKGTSNPFNVSAAGLNNITVNPADTSLVEGSNQIFTAEAFDKYGNALVGLTYTWSVLNAASGVINSGNGLFTAGNTPGDYINAIQVTSGGKTGVASVIVSPAPLVITNSAPLPIGQVSAVYPGANLTATGGTGSLYLERAGNT